MKETLITDIWFLFEGMLDKKLLDTAADQFVWLLSSNGVSDKKLMSILGTDKALDAAIEKHLADDEDESDEDGDELRFE